MAIFRPRNLLMMAISLGMTVYLGQAAAIAETHSALSANPSDLLRSLLEAINSWGTAGAIAFIATYIAAAVTFIPGSVLTLGAGVIFGVGWGSLYVFIGATLGAIAAFLIGRYFARDWVSQKIASNSNFKAIDQAVGQEGFKIVLLTRLSPVFPFNLLNYAYGVTSVTLKDYCLASIGMLPGTVMYVYIGSLAGNLATLGASNQSASTTAEWIIRIVGFIATVTVTVYITQIARKALKAAVVQSGDVNV